MAWVDWAIVALLAMAVLGGLSQGFFRSAFSLCGLLSGLVLAAWNYTRAATILIPLVRIEPVANAIGFLLIAIAVMAAANLLGGIIAKTLHRLGLGCLDRLAGGAFGLLQGALFVTVSLVAIVAFFPKESWLAQARLPRYFFGACHLSTHVSPGELAERVQRGLVQLEENSPEWMHPPAV